MTPYQIEILRAATMIWSNRETGCTEEEAVDQARILSLLVMNACPAVEPPKEPTIYERTKGLFARFNRG